MANLIKFTSVEDIKKLLNWKSEADVNIFIYREAANSMIHMRVAGNFFDRKSVRRGIKIRDGVVDLVQVQKKYAELCEIAIDRSKHAMEERALEEKSDKMLSEIIKQLPDYSHRIVTESLVKYCFFDIDGRILELPSTNFSQTMDLVSFFKWLNRSVDGKTEEELNDVDYLQLIAQAAEFSNAERIRRATILTQEPK